MLAHVAAALALQCIHVDAVAVQIAGQHRAVVFLGPEAALINEHAHMRVATAEFVRLVADAFADAVPFLRAGVPVEVVGGLFDDLIHMRIQMRAKHAAVVRTGDHMPQMADDGVDHEQVAILIPVMAPGVGAAVGHGFQNFKRRVVAPDGAVHPHSLVCRRAGCADA